MERRTFLSLSSLALSTVLYPKLTQAKPGNRAAIVIGINKSGSLPVLRAAASGAVSFANWLKGEGFEVKCFIDAPDIGAPDKKVKIDPIFEEVNRIVAKGIYDQLVIYFSGHGFLNSYRELWMLSDAPNNPNQAISLLECERLSKRTGIPNVVFISDACRSTATSLAADAVRGSVIFPTTSNSGRVVTKVDTFLATQEGDPAYEVGVQKASSNYHSIFTASFLDAFKIPNAKMVSHIDGVEVVLNRDLEDYLRSEVNKRAQQVSITLEQRPESNVLSDKYIGRVRRTGQSDSLSPSITSISDVTTLAFTEKGFEDLALPKIINYSKVKKSDKAKKFTIAKNKIITAEQKAPKSFETETGLFVSGADIDEVIINENLYRFEMAPSKGKNVIRLYPRRYQPASVAIRFSNGSGTVVAALRGYIGTIVVDEGRVVSVSYVRSGWGYSGSNNKGHLSELRRLVATSARFGTFRISGQGADRERRAMELANKIRMLKMIDPTLGIYAAYAYADADMPDQIKSVWNYMGNDINGEIYDVALLADKLTGAKPANRKGIAPFCPMLSQGWGLLRIANVTLHPDIDRARDFIKPALWTTFRKEGMDLIINAIKKGYVI